MELAHEGLVFGNAAAPAQAAGGVGVSVTVTIEPPEMDVA
jgi:hypothetical protein